MIRQDTLDRIRRETDLVALIGESLKLSKRGRSFVGLCPFHKEKTPSFHVNPERAFYHCFGCHESGDAIKFMQHVEGLEFVEAVRRLGDRLGIEVELDVTESERREHAEARRRSGEVYDALSLAASWFERMLREHELGGYASAELERRKLVPAQPTDAIADALQAFRIGYAPYAWDGLAIHLRERGCSLAAAERAGLVAPRKSGSGYYDRFRHRLMFAVLDAQGRVVAFSGRALDAPTAAELRGLGLEPAPANADKPPKYYNSPESAVYKKREALFGIYQARQAVRDTGTCVLVEGNFDVVSLHAAGVRNVVAPLGTAFTLEQAQQLRRYCGDVVLLFDGDTAGRRAVRAARDVCRRSGLNARVATLPEGVDPDALVRQRGSEGVQRVLGAARPLLEYLIEVVLDDPVAKGDARALSQRLQEVLELLETEDDPTVRTFAERHADAIAQRFNVSDAQTFRALVASVRQRLSPAPQQRASATSGTVPAPGRARSPDRREQIAFEIVGAFLDFPELMNEAEAAETATLLEGDAALAVAALRQSWDRDRFQNPEQVLAKLPAPIHSFARARLAAPRHMRPEEARTELAGNVRQLRALAQSREKKSVVEELERARRTGDFELEQALLRQWQEKVRQNKTLASE